MIRFGIVFIVFICLSGTMFAQIEEVPASRSEAGKLQAEERESMSEGMNLEDDSIPARDKRLSEQETEQIRNFITINSTIIIIVVLVVALVLFIIVRRVRRSKKQ